MNTMSSLSFRIVAALVALFFGCPRRSTHASDENPKGKSRGVFQIADLFSSILGDNPQNADADTADSERSAGTHAPSARQIMSSILERFQKTQIQVPQKATHFSDDDESVRRRKSNRRGKLYHRSIHAHYTRLVNEDARNSSSPLVDAVSFDDTIAYYNDGMASAFDAREIVNSDESIFSRFSHWTYTLNPKQSLSQVHLKPSAITDTGGATCCDFPNSKIFKLPPSSILFDSVQFEMTSVVQLGVYLPPGRPDFESVIRAAWGPEETKAPMPRGLVEYYVDGDACSDSRKRQSKVIYDLECCVRRQSMMEEFFENEGQLMIRSAEEPKPCRYELRACRLCPVDESRGNATVEAEIKSSPSVDPFALSHLLQTFLQGNSGDALPPMPPSQIEANKMLLRSMFTHAYDSYFHNAFPASELKPLTCQPGVFDLVKIPALTLIDTLGTLIIMGNYTEFARSVERLRYLDKRMKSTFQMSQGESKDDKRGVEKGGLFSVNQNVSLFETTIRVLGGLLSAHQMAVAFVANLVAKSDVWDASGEVLSSITRVVSASEIESENNIVGGGSSVDRAHEDLFANDDGDSHSCLRDSLPCPTAELGAREKKNQKIPSVSSSEHVPTWEYDGFLLELAHDIGKRLLLAFDTETGIPYGTVNLLHGVPEGETTVASLAGAGTLSLEFELLSRLTGDLSFGKAAKLATRALWIRGSPGLNLFGKHVDTESGRWVEHLSGVGSNSDSFYEYLIKHYLLFPDDSDWWSMFVIAYGGVHDNSRLSEWYVDVDMSIGLLGQIRQVFESLMAFYPGMQVLLGELVPAAKSLNSFFLVREFMGLLPERFNFVKWRSVADGAGDVHPLRPELLESCYFLHLASIGLHGSKRGPASHANSAHHTSSWLWAADFALNAINDLSLVPCGFATVAKLGPTTTGGLNFEQTEQKHYNSEHLNEMPSYFLSETIKYLYLTFDAEHNILHNDNERDWIFTTEAHPIHYVPVSHSTVHDDDRLETQLQQVRSLLKGRIIDSSLSIEAEFNDSAGTAPNKFGQERWTPLTPEAIFVASIKHVDNMVITSKRQTSETNDFDSGPPFQRLANADTSPQGIFASEINLAHYQFDDQGKGHGKMLSKRCPNFHHPDLQWIHALHGDSLEYNAAHSVSGESSPKHGTDERMLIALASACFYGTDYYVDGLVEDENKSCPLEDAPEYTTNFKKYSQPSDHIPGATRFDMGGDLGHFDVRLLSGGDGFIVKHVESQELVQVTIFEKDSNLHPSEDGGTSALVILTIPPPARNVSKGGLPEVVSTRNPTLSPRTVVSWRSLSASWVGRLRENHFSEDNTESKLAHDDYRRHVVVADMDNNSFRCDVAITKTNRDVESEDEGDVVLRRFACSPAFFGKTHIAHLRANGEEIVRGLVVSPPLDDEYGCKPQNDMSLIDQDICPDDEKDVVQIVRRGDCTFMSKASNYRHARGILVINTFGNDELFIMAGDTQLPEGVHDYLPMSVMVSGDDGDSILELIAEEQSNGNVVNLQILMTRAGDGPRFPYVIGSNEGLSVLASNGWGIQLTPQASVWQLFITQHTK